MAVELIKNNKETVLLFSSAKDKIEGSSDQEISDYLQNKRPKVIYAESNEQQFDTSLSAELFAWYQKLHNLQLNFNLERLPSHVRDLLMLALKPANTPPEAVVHHNTRLELIGMFCYGAFIKIKAATHFMHTSFVSLWRFICGKAIYRKKDFWFIFEDCSYKAVGITALVSFLVGLILAFVGAMQLRTFGAGIYVASMVALGMTRIMAAIMVGIIMAGRTGSSYAATLGTMQVNEEIDALKTLGIKVTDYLVAPRLVSLVLTIPFLTLLADALGIFGGTIVGIGFLGISPTTYFDYSVKALNLTNILVGLLHSLVYGFIIAISGCYEGLNAGRDADAVGKATTSAVVVSLVWMIVATGILTVILEVLGI